ncbi:hypothetical protein ACERII_09585 [Evansella sp. AB-rgal1]|uniref:hypothetical protein n=1 Tax=Evansella sp. AB-rgal1 TaxID=3242696 RepID=UPI00359DFF5F
MNSKIVVCLVHWHNFWYVWHYTKYHYYGSKRHEKNMRKHEYNKEAWAEGNKTQLSILTFTKEKYSLVKEYLKRHKSHEPS